MGLGFLKNLKWAVPGYAAYKGAKAAGPWLFGSNKKREDERTTNRGLADQERRRLTTGLEDLRKQYGGLLDESKGRDNQLYSGLFSGFNNQIDAQDSDNPAFAGYEELSHGGLDETAQNRLRGGGVYDEFSQTGGWSDSDKADYRSRAGSSTPALFDSLKSNLTRMNTVQGGYNPGYTSQMSKLTRDSSRENTRALNDAELGMQENIRSGRRWGTEGMTSSESTLQNLLGRNRETGLAGMRGVHGDTTQQRQFGLTGLNSLHGTNSNRINAVLQGIAQSFGLDASQVAAMLGIRGQNTPDAQQGHLDEILRLLESGAAAFA